MFRKVMVKCTNSVGGRFDENKFYVMEINDDYNIVRSQSGFIKINKDTLEYRKPNEQYIFERT